MPAPSDTQSPADHIQISRRFWNEHLPMELDKDNRLQAAEKIWGSVAHAIIAIGKQRGWKAGKTHSDLRAVVMQLGAELDAADGVPADAPNGNKERFRHLLSVVNGMHDNFYQNDEDEDSIADAERDAAELLARLEPLLDTPDQPFTPRQGSDQRRLARLLAMPLGRTTAGTGKIGNGWRNLTGGFRPGKRTPTVSRRTMGIGSREILVTITTIPPRWRALLPVAHRRPAGKPISSRSLFKRKCPPST